VRLAVFVVVVLLVMSLLTHVPLIGGLFQIPLLGLWVTALLVAWGAARLAGLGLERRRLARQRRELGQVDTPRNQGKLGALLLASGRARAALQPLERAVAGEPESLEWPYRLGLARLALGDFAGAAEMLASVTQRHEEFAYGGAQLALAQALSRAGRPAEALDALERFARNHGPSPESAYRTGRVLKALGRADEARAAFASVPELARRASGLQKPGARGWAFKSVLARWM